jgi:radical SAM superfamily enzyme YgiQ (UPF0313 family)
MLLISANKVTSPYPVFPLGVAFIQAALQRAGHAVRVWDPLVHAAADLADALTWADAVGVSLRNVDNVSAAAPEAYLGDYQALFRRLRAATAAPIIAGGSAFSIFPEEMLDALGLDWGVQGEAEEAVLLWLEVLCGKRSPDTVPGLVYRANGVIRGNPPRMLPGAAIPVSEPALDWVAGYVRQGGMLNVQTQRGCALRCTYCTYPWIEGNGYRRRDPRDLVREIRHLQQAGVRYVFLTDSVFNTDERHVRAVCTAFIQERLDIEWGCFARPQQIRKETLDLMIAAGMRHIEFGSDSFCDTILRSYGKSFRFRDIIAASHAAAACDVYACHYIIFGGPGETAATIRETVANARHLPDQLVFAFSGMRIYPHTPLHQHSGSGLSPRALLQPAFFADPAFPAAVRDRVVAAATAGLSNWILCDHADNYARLTAALRRRGKQGPLWEYLGLTQRLTNGQARPATTTVLS